MLSILAWIGVSLFLVATAASAIGWLKHEGRAHAGLLILSALLMLAFAFLSRNHAFVAFAIAMLSVAGAATATFRELPAHSHKHGQAHNKSSSLTGFLLVSRLNPVLYRLLRRLPASFLVIFVSRMDEGKCSAGGVFGPNYLILGRIKL